MMMYEKTMSRKVIVGLPKQENTNQSRPANSNSKPGANGAGTNGSANGNTSNTTTDAIEHQNKNQKGRAAKLELFKELFRGNKTIAVKNKGPATTGQILNLVRADADEIAQRFREIERMIKIPFGIIFAVWLICSLFGPSCLFAVLVVVIAQLINGGIARLQIRWRRYNKAAIDARIQINSQYIDVIRHLRWYDWHETWLAKVMAARQHELNVRIVSMAMNILSYFINVCANAVFPVIVFFAYTALAGHQLRIDLIFPALELFGNLNSRMRAVPNLITRLLNAYVAMERIEDFMKEAEKKGASDSPANSVPSANTAPPRMTDCTFAWPGTTTAVLQDVSLVIKTGLTVVYGKIGSGKTALLQALLGEMDLTSGKVDIQDKIMGYCSQTPWLQSISIRDNILFFSAYDEQRYQKVLESCALLPDLAYFKDGDKSLVGEK
jgi:ABC-type multidrug transport system fused ATPase/permease subunit